MVRNALHVAQQQFLQLQVAVGINRLQAHVGDLGVTESRMTCDVLRRIGWQIPKSIDEPPEKLRWWLTSDTIVTRHDDQVVAATLGERLDDVVESCNIMLRFLGEKPKSRCAAYSQFRRWHIDQSNKYPLGHLTSKLGQIDRKPFHAPENFFSLCFDEELIAGTVTDAATILSEPELIYTAGLRVYMEGREAHEYVLVSEAERFFRDALESIRGGWRRAIFESVELPPGWELAPNGDIHPVRDFTELAEWLRAWLNLVHETHAKEGRYTTKPDELLPDVQRELSNARKAMRYWNHPIPDCLRNDPIDMRDAERRLETLIDSLSEMARQTERGPATGECEDAKATFNAHVTSSGFRTVQAYPWTFRVARKEDGWPYSMGDGTNFAMQPYKVSEKITDEWFRHGQPEVAGWWPAMEAVRKKLRHADGTLRVITVQETLGLQPEESAKDPGETALEGPFGLAPGLSLPIGILCCSEQGTPIEAEWPLYASGKPIQNSAGDPYSARMGVRRSHYYKSTGVSAEILSALETAGRLSTTAPLEVHSLIWGDWEGFQKPYALGLWFDALVEIGRARLRSCGLQLERSVRNGSFYVQLSSPGRIPQITDLALGSVPLYHGFPYFWDTCIENVIEASLFAVEFLLDYCSGPRSSTQPSQASNSAEPATDGEPIDEETTAAGEPKFASIDDPIPDGFRDEYGEIGPLEGTATKLLSTVCNNKRKDKKLLLKRHTSGQNFVKQLEKRKFAMFFRRREQLTAAKEKLRLNVEK